MRNLMSVYLEIVLVLVRDSSTVCTNCTSLRNHFRHTRRNCQVTWVMWNLVLVRLVIVLVPVHDGCIVCAKCTIGLEIILDALNCTPR